mmetsp:Transcript_38705/g.67186  ORF Transcript_38705/g.67186 Transcript_38705/m.67186 type:complete len:265 (+) Transcript_38705:65-859(+)
MRAAACILACLARAGLGRRVQMPASQKAESHDVKALAGLFDSLAPAAGYQIPGAGLGMDRVVKTSRASDQAQMMARRRGGRSKFDPELYPGVQAPTGFWDPLGFCADGDEEAFLRRRAVEVKHGRVAMLACLGYIVPYFVRLPGSLTLDGSVKFADVPVGIKALSVVPPLGIAQIFLLGLVLEFGPFRNDPEFPGDFGWDPLGLRPDDPDLFLKKKNAELANGRLAMFASLGFIASDIISDGNPYAGSLFGELLKPEVSDALDV